MASVVDINVSMLAGPFLLLQRLPHDAATATTAPYSPDVASLAVTDMHSETLEADSMKIRVQNLPVVRQSHRSAFLKLSSQPSLLLQCCSGVSWSSQSQVMVVLEAARRFREYPGLLLRQEATR